MVPSFRFFKILAAACVAASVVFGEEDITDNITDENVKAEVAESDLPEQSVKVLPEKGTDKEQKSAAKIKQAEVSTVEGENIGKDEQFVIINARLATSKHSFDVYFDGEFVTRMPRKMRRQFVLKRGTHTVTIAQTENDDGVWRIRRIENANFTLSDDVVELRIGTMHGRLEAIVDRYWEKSSDAHKQKILGGMAQEVYRVNTKPSTNPNASRRPNIAVDKQYKSKIFVSLKYLSVFAPDIAETRTGNFKPNDYNLKIDDAFHKWGTTLINNVHFEVGGIKNGKVLITGITDISGYGAGGGVSVGRVAGGKEVFKFVPALNLGVWGYKTSHKEVITPIFSDELSDLTWDKTRILFGGPELRIMLGYKHVFADMGYNCMMGFSRDRFRVITENRLFNSSGFSAMIGYNIGLTVTF